MELQEQETFDRWLSFQREKDQHGPTLYAQDEPGADNREDGEAIALEQ